MSASAVITAHWRNVAILSWPTGDDFLAPFLPTGLSLDRWNGKAYISLVCLLMENVRFVGLPALPRKFAEINVRFYVRPADPCDDRIGVVFLKQIVSNRCVAFAGRRLFREPMLSAAVSHDFKPADPVDEPVTRRLCYRWRNRGRAEELRVTGRGETYHAEPDSLDEFLTARYWGYNRQSGNSARAYRISREPWSLVPVVDHELTCDAGTFFGPRIADVLAGPPASALLALGSESRVHWPTKLR